MTQYALYCHTKHDNKQKILQNQHASPGRIIVRNVKLNASVYGLTVQAVATPIKQYNCTLGYACPFPSRLAGQNFCTQSISRTNRGGNICSASFVPDTSREITLRILSRSFAGVLKYWAHLPNVQPGEFDCEGTSSSILSIIGDCVQLYQTHQ